MNSNILSIGRRAASIRQTLRQVLEYALAEKQDIPAMCITDSPDLLRRGFMLDISRDKVPTMKTLYQIVDLLASWKVNEFQLYTEHTFAYKNHKEVWENSSPMTPEEIALLQKYCNDRFIDLVPNQNSFGHFENWLKYDTYLHLADCPTDCATIWGARSRSSLDPTNPASFDLVKELYDELLPNFNSKYFNIGCDETVELGLGNSKKMCDSIGLGRVYLNFLLKLNEEVNRHGKLAQYWGDIVIDHDSLIPYLPKNMTCMVWGYDTQYDFDKTLAKFEKAGLRFYVCPGTATWRSIIGRNDIAFTNEYNAAVNAVKHGAAGMLVTNWGDLGHWQPLSVCYAPIMVGCSYAWRCDSSITSRVDFLLNQYLFEDPTGNLGKAVMKLSYAHTYAKSDRCGNIFREDVDVGRGKARLDIHLHIAEVVAQFAHHVGDFHSLRNVVEVSVTVVKLDGAGFVLHPLAIAVVDVHLRNVGMADISVENRVGVVGIHVAVVDEGAETGDGGNLVGLDDVDGERGCDRFAEIVVREGKGGSVGAGFRCREGEGNRCTIIGQQIVVAERGDFGGELAVAAESDGGGAVGGEVVAMNRQVTGKLLIDRNVVERGSPLNLKEGCRGRRDDNVVQENAVMAFKTNGDGAFAVHNDGEIIGDAVHLVGFAKIVYCVFLVIHINRHVRCICVGIPHHCLESDTDRCITGQRNFRGLDPAVNAAGSEFYLAIGMSDLVSGPAGKKGVKAVCTDCVCCRAALRRTARTTAGHNGKVLGEDDILRGGGIQAQAQHDSRQDHQKIVTFFHRKRF